MVGQGGFDCNLNGFVVRMGQEGQRFLADEHVAFIIHRKLKCLLAHASCVSLILGNRLVGLFL